MKTDSYLGRLIHKVTGNEVVEAAQSADFAALQTEFEAFKLDASTQLAELSTSLEAALATIAQADADKVALESKLAEALAATQALEATAEAKRLAARKEKILAAVGTSRAESVFAATEAIDEANFETVLAALSAAGSVEGQSKFFTAQGADVEVDAKLVTQGESAEMKLLKQMFPPVA